MKVINFFKNSFILLGELAIFIVALSWFHTCNEDDCHEPLIAMIGSSLPLILGVSLRIIDWFKKSEIKKYCESIYSQSKNIHLPLVSQQALQNGESDYSLSKSIPISHIYIDLPLQTLKQTANISSKSSNAFRILHFKLINPFPKIKYFWNKKQKNKKSSFLEYNNTMRTSFTGASKITTSTISNVLNKGKKVIVIGDRGSGKSTLLRYLAYAYSYQLTDPKNFNRDKDIKLPKIKWIPVIIRCGNLNLNSTTNFSLILKQHLLGVHLYTDQTNELYKKIFSELTKGSILLLIDGIDEIKDLDLRKQFCFSLNSFIQTYPKTTVLITCIETIFAKIGECFDEHFKVVKVSKLSFDHKKRFIQKWAQKVEQNAESVENLQNALITSRNLGGLTNNIQALSLIIQLPNINSLLQVNFATILREVIKLLIKKSEIQLNKSFQVNEIVRNLSEVALFMSNHKSNTIEESDVIKIVNASNQQISVNWTYEPHSPHLLLRVFDKHMGILTVANSGIDSTGIEHKFYKFIHPTFQDFFRVQAMMRHFNMKDVLSQLGIPDNPNDVGAISIDRSISNLVFSELPLERAEEVLLTILYPQNNIGAEKLRTRVIFGANLLASAPFISNETAVKVIYTLFESINPGIDCKGNIAKTPLDEAVYNLLHSPWSNVFEASLFEAYVSYIGDKRIAIGSIISTEIIDELIDLKSLSVQEFCTLIENNSDQSEQSQIFERLKLMSFAFGKHGNAVAGYFDISDTKKLYDLLLDFSNTSEAVQMTSVWALGWVLNAKNNRFMPKVKLNEAHASILMEYLSHSDNDSRGLYWSALCLSRCEPVQLQPDWTYEWATVADYHRPQSDISLPILYKIRIIDKVVDVLTHVLSSNYHPLAKEGSVLTLGRLGHYPAEAGPVWLRIFEDIKYSESIRQEALNYLVQMKDKAIERQIYSTYKAAFIENDEFKKNHTYLALLAIGNLDILKEIIFQGVTDLYEVGSMHPAFFAIKTNRNQNHARKLLNELKNCDNPEVRDLSKIALTDFTGQSKAQAIQTVLTQLETGKLGADASEGLAEKAVCILLVRGENPDGRAIFAYVAVRADKLHEFMEAQKTGIFYVEDYGVVLESGEGEPSEEIRKKMEDEYGFDHTGMINL